MIFIDKLTQFESKMVTLYATNIILMEETKLSTNVKATTNAKLSPWLQVTMAISTAGLQKGVYAVQLGQMGSTLIRL